MVRFLPLLVLGSGCAARHWTKTGMDPEVRDKDLYACMKENTYYGDDVSSTRAGYRRSKGMKVSQELLWACMKAKGYHRDRVVPRGDRAGPKPLGAQPLGAQPRLAGELGLTVGTSFGSEAESVGTFSPEGATFVGHAGSFSRAAPSVGARLGAILHTNEFVDVSVGAGLRSASRRSSMHLFEDDDVNAYDCCDFGARQSSRLVVVPAAEVRLRAPFLTSLQVIGGIAAQQRPAIDAATEPGLRYDVLVDEEAWEWEERTSSPFELPGSAGAWMPIARVGVGFDWMAARPQGFRTDCYAQLVVGDPGGLEQDPELLAQEYSWWHDTEGVSCGISWTFGLTRTHSPEVAGR